LIYFEIINIALFTRIKMFIFYILIDLRRNA